MPEGGEGPAAGCRPLLDSDPCNVAHTSESGSCIAGDSKLVDANMHERYDPEVLGHSSNKGLMKTPDIHLGFRPVPDDVLWLFDAFLHEGAMSAYVKDSSLRLMRSSSLGTVDAAILNDKWFMAALAMCSSSFWVHAAIFEEAVFSPASE